MIQLNNNLGARPLVWHVTHGDGDGWRPFMGRVLAHLSHNKLHPFVVWTIVSDDGNEWACQHGDYCENMADAEKIFADRAKTLPRRGWVTNKQEGESNG